MRAKKNHIAVSTFICSDKNLSLKAKGLWLYAMSVTEGKQLELDEMLASSNDDLPSIESALEELQNAGYLILRKEKDVEVWIFNAKPKRE